MHSIFLAAFLAVGCLNLPTTYGQLRRQLPLTHHSSSIQFRQVSDQSFHISDFSWQICSSSSNATLQLKTLVLGENDAFTVPGNVSATVNAAVDAQLASPLRAEVKLWKKVFVWIEMPCQIGKINLCNIPDVCALLPAPPCPSWMTQNNVPCQCPIPSKAYALNDAEVTVPPITIELPPIIDDGSYKIEMSLYDANDTQLGCIRIFAKVHAKANRSL